MKNIVVTGDSGVICGAIAEAFAEHDTTLPLVYKTRKNQAEKLSTRLTRQYGAGDNHPPL